jgi:hypothetical protein
MILGMPTKKHLRLQNRSWPQCLTKGKELLKLLQKKKVSFFGTWSDKNYLRPRRSYMNMAFPVANSQEPYSLVESMKRPWDVFVTVPGRR